MFALSWVEIAFFALTAGGIGVAAVALGKAKEFQTPLAVFVASIMIPAIGPAVALVYGAISWSSRAGARLLARSAGPTKTGWMVPGRP